MGDAGGFGDREGVHIGAEADAGPLLATVDDADDTGFGKTGDDLVDPELAKMVLDDLRGPGFLEGEFGVAVEVVTPLDHVGVELGDAVDYGHGGFLKVRGEAFGQGDWGNAQGSLHGRDVEGFVLEQAADLGATNARQEREAGEGGREA